MSYKRYARQLSAWGIPAFYALVAVAAGLTFPRVESRVFPGLAVTVTVSSATAIGSAIASGMIALTGIVFSLAFVMIQFSSIAYSPRLALWIARDPFLKHALGIFTATFLYALAALAWVGRNGSSTVPFFSSWIVIVLLLASVGMFVGLTQRLQLLQVNSILRFTGDQGREVIKTVYPLADSIPPRVESTEFREMPPTQTLLHHGEPHVIQAIDTAAMVKLANDSGGVIEMVATVGDTVAESTPLLNVFGARQPIDERKLRYRIEMGGERTFEQDPKYAIRLLVDIAIRALSPAINDPTTAVQALDQIGDLLLRLGQRQLEIGAFPDSDGKLRLVVPVPTWDDLLRLAFDEIRSYGANSVQVMRRMNALISDLIPAMPEPRRASLKHWDKRLQATIARSFTEDEERVEASLEDRQGLGIPRRRSSKDS
jgi:uncharacterized membrane protein